MNFNFKSNEIVVLEFLQHPFYSHMQIEHTQHSLNLSFDKIDLCLLCFTNVFEFENLI